MKLEIRRMMAEDAETYGAITARSWQVAYRGIVPADYLGTITPELRTRRFRQFYGPGSGVDYYLAQVDGEDAGVFCLQADRDAPSGRIGEIGVFYFLPAFWGTGAAPSAMAFALERLRQRGYEEAILWVLAGNARARRFYEKCGFVSDGAAKAIHLGADLAEVRYRRNLTEGR